MTKKFEIKEMFAFIAEDLVKFSNREELEAIS